MTLWEVVLAAGLVATGAGVLVCVVAMCWRGPSTAEREAVQDAPRAVGRASVVASEDLTWQVDLAMFYRDYETYRTELRLPGERAS